MNYSELKFEQAAFCFLTLYQAKGLSDFTMEQFVECVCFESIECCSLEPNTDSYRKAYAVITLTCLERTGYILSERHIKLFQKYLEISEDELLFKNEELSEYRSDLKTAVGYLEWSKGKAAQK